MIVLVQNGKWNGIMAELIAKKFDMVLTSLKINAERESVVDFTAPFLGRFFKIEAILQSRISPYPISIKLCTILPETVR